MWNNNGGRGHPCGVNGKGFQLFLMENDIRCRLFVDGFYEIEECTLYPYTVEGFNQERMLYLVKCSFCIN